MKKIFLLTVITMSFVSFSSCEKKTVLSESQLPSEIKSYVNTHFSDYSILQVVKDKDGVELTYDVMLTEEISLEFNRKKEIIDIDGNRKFGLPNSVIPEKILTYVQSNYSDNYIIGWEKSDNKNQKIDLDNNLELLFNKSGDFLRFDD